jgi:UDP-N-acetylmuramoyl-tripeptide--D-alanyl-D-alanine ligase
LAPSIRLDDLLAVTRGRLLRPTNVTSFSGAAVDSRHVTPGCCFVALRGERVDGHSYVAEALRNGAQVALVARPVAVEQQAGAAIVQVDDSLAALQELAAWRRDRSAVRVVGITGSTGKTSTKDLTAAALASAFPVSASPASWNNEIGVPLTLLATGDDARAAVLEMGARGMGHIAALCAIARPSIGVITNIGLAHAEFFGSRAEVARAKGELVEALPATGTAVLSADDDTTPALAARTEAAVLTAGTHPDADVRVSDVRLDADLRPSFRLDTPWGGAEVGPLAMRGAHQAVNAALAVAVAGVLGVSPGNVAEGLSTATGSSWRMELARTPGGLIVLNDAYNANPTSMAAALAALAGLGSGRRFAILGHMAELGARSEELHGVIGRQAVSCRLKLLVLVGREAAGIAKTARDGGLDVVEVDSADEALAAVSGELRPGDAVLVKASRVVGLERLAAALCEWEPPR